MHMMHPTQDGVIHICLSYWTSMHTKTYILYVTNCIIFSEGCCGVSTYVSYYLYRVPIFMLEYLVTLDMKYPEYVHTYSMQRPHFSQPRWSNRILK